MNSLPFSINTYNPTSRLVRSFTRRNLHSHNIVESSSSSVKFGESEQVNNRLTSSAGSLSRREALGLSLCFSFSFLNPQLKSFAAAEENSQCEFVQATNGLAFCDKFIGTGPEAVKGQLIKAHYVGKLEDGKVFDSSYNRGKPLTFRVGVGEVIKGWDQGILGGDGIPPMLAGGKRKLKIPPELGYGMRGAGCRGGSCIIPPNSVLLFDVEFVGKAA